MRYAYFANARRLAVDSGGEVWVYDTQDHQIGGFSQQQGSGSSITLSSQYGAVNLATLPVVMKNGAPVLASVASASVTTANGSTAESDIFAAIERLASLKSSGAITDYEFTTKKAELLARL